MADHEVKASHSTTFRKIDRNSKAYAYWKKMYYSANAARKEGWRRFYESSADYMRLIKMIDSAIDGGLPLAARAKYAQFVARFDEDKRKCLMCQAEMKFDESEYAECGHMFHVRCLMGAASKPGESCPICHGKLFADVKPDA